MDLGIDTTNLPIATELAERFEAIANVDRLDTDAVDVQDQIGALAEIISETSSAIWAAVAKLETSFAAGAAE